MWRKFLTGLLVGLVVLPFLVEAPQTAEISPPTGFERIANFYGHSRQYVEAGVEAAVTFLAYAAIKFVLFVNDPQVELFASTIVAPFMLGLSLLTALALISWIDLESWLRLMISRFRRKSTSATWGLVYNSLNKLPVDLATVRLLNHATGRIVQSRVTDSEGRYAFVTNPGQYRLEVVKAGLQFPSELLLKSKEDGRKTDLYHGEVIAVTEQNTVIARIIPIDPAGEHTRPIRLWLQGASRRVRLIVSWLGLGITFLVVCISARWYVWVLLGLQTLLFTVLRLLALPKPMKRWGTVYDQNTKKSLGDTVVRLFNAQFNKLVASQITDRTGRYYFVAGDGKYFLSFEHPNYLVGKTEILEVQNSSTENITVDIGLEKKLYKHPHGFKAVLNPESSEIKKPDVDLPSK